jgi:acyl-CoA reductase-like NAD-dependent aldehyde dehydrogenase
VDVESGTAARSEPATDARGNGKPSGETFDVTNPATGEVLTSLEVDGPERVHAVAERLRAAQPAWEALGNDGRARWLAKLRDWMLDNLDEIADTMQAETGKVRGEAGGEVVYLTDLINLYGRKAKQFIGDEHVPSHSPLLKSKRLVVQYRPHPLVGVISPWNYPLILSLGDAIPALQAGAAVLIKPSEFTPLGLREIAEAWKTEIGAPDVFDVVNGMGETGSALVDEADFIQFTGSDRTGKRVMARAAETLTPVSLELGGKDPMIVLRDADVERAVNAATWGSFQNSGQTCISVERVYVEEPIYDDFVRRLTEEVGKLKQGQDGRDFGCDVGAMTSPAQTEVVEDHVSDALASGAKALTGGKRREGPGDYYEPTVLVDVDHSMKVMRDETFGPVVGVMKVADEEEAIRLANDTRYGLSGSVFGEKDHAERVARRIEAGMVNVNDALIGFLLTDVPFGGWKDSGIGLRHGEYGIKKYCRAESLVITRFGGKRDLLWFPYTKKRRLMMRRLFNFFNARDWKRRLGRNA